MATLLYDHREERSTIPGLLALEGFEMVAQQLPVGDYILSDRLAIERKTATDLISSITDRRLWEQADRLKEAYPAIILIVEGTPERFPAESWRGALGSVLAMGGISVLTTADVRRNSAVDRPTRPAGSSWTERSSRRAAQTQRHRPPG